MSVCIFAVIVGFVLSEAVEVAVKVTINVDKGSVGKQPTGRACCVCCQA